MPTQIPQGTGTAIGNMTAQGGLAAAFDGVTSQVNTLTCNTVGNSATGYNNTVGKDWGSGVTKKITQFSFWGPSDTGIVNTLDTTVKLQGSQNNSAWVDLYTSGTLTGSGSSAYTTTINSGIDISTAYRYHRLNINGDNTHSGRIAELQFFEPTANTLSATKGTFSVTGVAALLHLAVKYSISCLTGAYTVTGVAAAVKAARKIACVVASFTVTGIALEVVRIVAPANKFRLRLQNYVLQKLRVTDPTLGD